MDEYILEMRDIVKEFPGVRALKGVQLKVRPGTVHTLMGENGAEKSTSVPSSNVLEALTFTCIEFTPSTRLEGSLSAAIQNHRNSRAAKTAAVLACRSLLHETQRQMPYHLLTLSI